MKPGKAAVVGAGESFIGQGEGDVSVVRVGDEVAQMHAFQTATRGLPGDAAILAAP